MCSVKDRMAGTTENASSDLYKQNESFICVALCLGKVFFFKEKKIVYSMERLAVRAVNVSGDGSKSKIFEKQKLCIEREKKVYYKTSPKKILEREKIKMIN